MSNDAGPVIYHVNEVDVVDYVNDAWRAFARENDAPALADSVVGTVLWHHIDGPEIEQIYRELLSRVRQKQVSATLPMRCDSPTVYRQMRLVVLPMPQGRVEFRAVIDAQGPHAELASQPVGAYDRPLVPFLRMCSWCKAIMVDNVWRPIEEVLEQQKLFLAPRLPQITHGMCEACAVEFADDRS